MRRIDACGVAALVSLVEGMWAKTAAHDLACCLAAWRNSPLDAGRQLSRSSPLRPPVTMDPELALRIQKMQRYKVCALLLFALNCLPSTVCPQLFALN